MPVLPTSEQSPQAASLKQRSLKIWHEVIVKVCAKAVCPQAPHLGGRVIHMHLTTPTASYILSYTPNSVCMSEQTGQPISVTLLVRRIRWYVMCIHRQSRRAL